MGRAGAGGSVIGARTVSRAGAWDRDIGSSTSRYFHAWWPCSRGHDATGTSRGAKSGVQRRPLAALCSLPSEAHVVTTWITVTGDAYKRATPCNALLTGAAQAARITSALSGRALEEGKRRAKAARGSGRGGIYWGAGAGPGGVRASYR